MACSCGKKRTGGAAASTSYTVKLPGGLKITKPSEAAALAFAAKHPGATVKKA